MRPIKDAGWYVLSKFVQVVIIPIMDRGRAKKFQERRRRNIEGQNTRRANWNASLPPTRSDTIEVSALSAATDGISTQPQCLFFMKLPPELRTMIYLYALGNEELEIELFPEEIKLWRYYINNIHPVPVFDVRCARFLQLTAFPRSCKLAYSESIQHLYASNTFYFPTCTAFFCFQRLVPTHHFQAIQSLYLKWASDNPWKLYLIWEFCDGVPPYDLSSWNRTWKIISKTEALKYMRVDLVACADRPEPYSEFEDVLFAPLKKIQGLQQFDVFLSWEEGKTVREEGVQPFTIKKTMEHVR